ncbi:bifunctional DNA primase/polymerase [Streptomyces sp. NPDC050204]|uniref:bifunctional DNA primase/polymerase n=1 Tax=Streptomyces sp. NPDC050204 TaxID=3155514 RepID=UPI0034232F8B
MTGGEGTGDQRRELKAVALTLAARGWHVFPLRPGTIEPAVRNWAARATTNAWRIVRCWDSGPFNVGIAPCASGLLVLDLVPAGPQEVPPAPYRLPGVVDGADVLAVLLDEQRARMPVETYSVRGPGARWQYYFTRPPATCPPAAPSPLAWHVEVRCTGSYVPAAGSRTPEGVYTVVHDAVPVEAPAWLTGEPTSAFAAGGSGPKGLDSLQCDVV